MMKHKNLLDPSIGLRIRLQRKKKGLSLEDLAWKTGISISHISKIERGESFPSDEILRKLEDGLDLEYESLEKGQRPMIMNDNVEQTAGEIKIDLLQRNLSEQGMMAIAHITKAVADAIEMLDL